MSERARTEGLDRRDFLKLTGATGAGLLIARRSRLIPAARAAATERTFVHGVASGDPTATSVILWTRVTPIPDATPGSGVGPPTDLEYEIARDTSFTKIVRRAGTRTSAARDHTVKIDARGLDPDTVYYYRFRHRRELSPIGRTRTTVAPRVDNASLRFGLASCSNWEGGFFAAYRYLARRRDLDFILHVGDYLYEYGPGGYGEGNSFDRVHEPDHEIVSLADYRIRHAQYKTDPDLQACHAAYPFITTWDDHEVTNDTWRRGAENHQEDEGRFLARRNRAYQAYFEWMPIRIPSGRDRRRIYRRLSFGRLADLHVLDTRQYRDRQPDNQLDPAKDEGTRTITGARQMKWLKRGLASPGSRWRLIGNQLMITPWEVGVHVPFNVDAWDGYRADRNELLGHIQGSAIENVVFLTGDIHTSWANEVPIDPTTYPVSPPAAVEVVGPSITSDNLDEITGNPPRTTSVAIEQAIKADNLHVKFVELDSHGYSVVDVDRNRLHAEWFFVHDRTDPDTSQSFGAAYEVPTGTNSVEPADGPIRQERSRAHSSFAGS